MSTIFQSINNFVLKLADREADPINSARVKMLTYILLLYLPYTFILVVIYYLTGEKQHLMRVSAVFVISPLLIMLMYYVIHAWKIASHIVLCTLTLVVWSNLSFFVKGINVATLQFIWFASALGFYMHGLKWGWVYSFVNIVPVLIYLIFENKAFLYLGTGPYQINKATYLFVVTYNFTWIVYMHYYFFKTFNQTVINLTEAKQEIKRSSNAKMTFLSTMSHELRTPLNGVIGISNALLFQNPREDQLENLDVLKFSAENLLSLINDILDFNKFDEGKVELEKTPFNLTELIKNNYSSLKLKANEKMLDLNLSITEDLKDKAVTGDPTRLTQILLNLLNNAIKFTEKGSVGLDIKTIGLTEENITLRFTVTDTGIGIELDRQQAIFEPFIQASTDTNRNYGGTGLGLPIVKRILAMFDSSINLISDPGAGTEFFFDIIFGYQPLTNLNTSAPLAPTANLAHMKVLVAEDNAVNILVIKKTLERWGIHPVIAENGAIALQELEQKDFDVILMDLYMPVLDGYKTASMIRKMSNKSKAQTPIIALTAIASDNIAEMIAGAGMNDYLSKPFNPDHLFIKLNNFFSMASATTDGNDTIDTF